MNELIYLLTYIEGRGIQAYGGLDTLYNVIRALDTERCTSIEQLISRSISVNVTKGALALLWRLKLLHLTSSEKGYCYRLLVNIDSREELQFALLFRAVNWLPIRLLLEFAAKKGGKVTSLDTTRELGSRMKETTSKYYKILHCLIGDRGLRPEGVQKPFNRHVVEAVLFRFLLDLGILQGTTKNAKLTDTGWFLVNDVQQRSYTVLTTEPSYPQIGVATAAIFGASSPQEEVISATYSLDVVIAKPLIELAGRANRSLVFVLGRPAARNANKLSKICKQHGLHCDILCVDELHAKLYAGAYTLLTSANLTRAGLTRNYEIGVLMMQRPSPEVLLFINALGSKAQSCNA